MPRLWNAAVDGDPRQQFFERAMRAAHSDSRAVDADDRTPSDLFDKSPRRPVSFPIQNMAKSAKSTAWDSVLQDIRDARQRLGNPDPNELSIFPDIVGVAGRIRNSIIGAYP